VKTTRAVEEERMQTTRSASGFTLIELMVAMTVTLIVMGAVVGLLTSGQTSFRREPAIADMQQNLRSAMDIIMRDVAAGGTGIPTELVRPGTGYPPFHGSFVQVFTPAFDDGKACIAGVAHDTGPTACPRPLRPGWPDVATAAQRTDDLGVITSNTECGAEGICGYTGTGSYVHLDNNSTCVQANATPLFFTASGAWTIRRVGTLINQAGGPTGGTCGSTNHARLTFTPATGSGVNEKAGLCELPGVGTINGNESGCQPAFALAGAEAVSFRISVDADGVPNLERRSSATATSAWVSNFQVIARGVEDMQVQYEVAGDPGDGSDRTPRWLDEAPITLSGNYNTMVRAVRVTLSGRTTLQSTTEGGGALSGASADARGNLYVRSSLTSTAAVRTALLHASRQYVDSATTQAPSWN
jgi:prepilin-type N-terminal cleavage/methylation domain-containing protein